MDTAQKSFTYYGDLKKRLLVAEALKAEYEKVMSPTNQRLRGFLAHKKQRPPRTLRQDYAQGPLEVLGGGRLLMSEEPI